MKWIIPFLLLSGSAMAQTAGTFVAGQPLPAASLNAALAAKMDAPASFPSSAGVTDAMKLFGSQSGSNASATAAQVQGYVIALPAGKVLSWNGDVGLSRDATGDIAVGNGTQGDLTGSIDLAKVVFQANVNFTQTALGQLQLGSGGTPGTGGSLSLTNLTASGTVTGAGVTVTGLSGGPYCLQETSGVISSTGAACLASGSPGTTWAAYPVQWFTPFSTAAANNNFLYATTGSPGGTYTSPYQDILAIGERTINPTTHQNGAKCTAFDNPHFCGDEVAFGTNTLRRDIDGRDNTAIGDNAGAGITHGLENTLVGSSAGANLSTANDVIAIGVSACQNVTTLTNPLMCLGLSSFQNAGSTSGYGIALGVQTAITATTVQNTIAVGDGAGYNATSITDSVLIGRNAASNGTSISNSIYIGEGGPASGAYSNALWIGGGTNPPIQGNLSTNALLFPGTLTLSVAPVLSSLSGILQGNGGSAVTAVPTTGSGNVVLATSPTLTGVPVAPTAAVGTATTQIATTTFANAAAAARGLQSNGQQVITTNTTLGATQAGANTLVTGAGITITFPSTTATYALNNIGSANATLAFPSGSDFGITLYPQQQVVLAGDGTGYWRVITSSGVYITPPVAIASLPSSPVAGQRAAVNNADACTFGATPAHTTGSVFCPVIYNGSAWVAG